MAAELAGLVPGGLPVVFVLGTEGASKTNAILQSGMEPELLAGQIYDGTNVVPTRTGNVWFARNALYVEWAGRLAAELFGQGA